MAGLVDFLHKAFQCAGIFTDTAHELLLGEHMNGPIRPGGRHAVAQREADDIGGDIAQRNAGDNAMAEPAVKIFAALQNEREGMIHLGLATLANEILMQKPVCFQPAGIIVCEIRKATEGSCIGVLLREPVSESKSFILGQPHNVLQGCAVGMAVVDEKQVARVNHGRLLEACGSRLEYRSLSGQGWKWELPDGRLLHYCAGQGHPAQASAVHRDGR